MQSVSEGGAHIWDEGTGCSADVAMYKDAIWTIWSLYCPPNMRQMGGAARVMREITEFLDARKMSARLQAQPFMRSTGITDPHHANPVGLELDRLIRFYEGFGFRVTFVPKCDDDRFAIMHRMMPGELVPYRMQAEDERALYVARNAIRDGHWRPFARHDYSEAVAAGLVFG